MGCDIHAVIEFEDGEHYWGLTSGPFRLGRDYRLFTALAGVRAAPGETPLFPPRGLPPDPSSDVFRLYFHRVSDDPKHWDAVKPAHAEAAVASGRSFYAPDAQGRPRAFVSDSD